MTRVALIPRLTLILLFTAACGDGKDGDAVDVASDGTPDVLLDAVPDIAADASAPIDLPDLEETPTDTGPLDVPPPPPPQLLLTVNQIPAYLNGSQPYTQAGESHEFRLWVNRHNFTLDAHALPEGGPVDWSGLAVTCDTALGLPDGTTVATGEVIDPTAFEVGADDSWRRIRFDTGSSLPDGEEVSCAASATGPGGTASSHVPFVAAELPTHLDPFVQPDVWLVTLSRDIFQLEVETNPDGTLAVTSLHVPQGNGQPDFDEPFYLLGLFSELVPEATAHVRGELLDTVRSHAYRIFGLSPAGELLPDGVPLRLYFESDAGAPDPADFDASAPKVPEPGAPQPFSMIALGGDGTPADQQSGIVGRASIDWNNQHWEDNTVYDRGVYPTAIVRMILAEPIAQFMLGDFMPGSGTPIGEHPLDATFLVDDFEPSTIDDATAMHRYEVYALVIDLLGRSLASLLCHEIGHSLGLVPHGPPPTGLFAEMPDLDITTAFVPGSHIDTPGVNVMQTGASTNWAEAVNQLPWFNPLNTAYLKRQLVVLGNP